MGRYSIEPSEVLAKYKVVAVVGASKNPAKDAYSVPAYLRRHGYEVIPINPTTDIIDGVKTYPTLGDLPPEVAERVDVVDVFRPSEELPEIARQVVEMKKKTGRPYVFWSQLGLESEEAKKILTEGNVQYVMDRCMRTEHMILGSAYMSGGRMNTEWHNAHPMPENPTREQRAKWHFEHAEACGCRSVPQTVGDDVRELIRLDDMSNRPK